MKFRQRLIATELRKKGHSYSSIRRRTGVSKGTLSLWLRDVELSPKQKAKILRGLEVSRDAAAKKRIQDRIDRTQKIISNATEETPHFIKDPLFVAGVSLYWAEGAKNASEKVTFVNSDALMIKIIMRWFREVCLVPENKFRVHIHVHDLYMKGQIRRYWSRVTRISENQFYKTYVKKSSLGTRRNILYYGTCSITVNDRQLFRRIVGWRKGLLQYFDVTDKVEKMPR